jgi:hypothetical protein
MGLSSTMVANVEMEVLWAAMFWDGVVVQFAASLFFFC